MADDGADDLAGAGPGVEPFSTISASTYTSVDDPKLALFEESVGYGFAVVIRRQSNKYVASTYQRVDFVSSESRDHVSISNKNFILIQKLMKNNSAYLDIIRFTLTL